MGGGAPVFHPSDGPAVWTPGAPWLGPPPTQRHLGQTGEGCYNTPWQVQLATTAGLAVVSPRNLATFARRSQSNNAQKALTPPVQTLSQLPVYLGYLFAGL